MHLTLLVSSVTFFFFFKPIARSLFFACLMSQVKGWDGFWLDDFRCPEHFLGGNHLFAPKSLLEPIVAWFES